MAERSVYIRLGVRDADKAVAALQSVGIQGERALNRVASAGEPATAGMRAVSAAANDMGASFGTAAGRLGPAGSALSALGPAGLAAAAGIGTAAAALVGLVRSGDQLQSLEGRLRSATGSAAAAAQSYEKLYKVALDAGAGMGDLVGGFSRFNIAARQIGATRDEVGRLVEIVTKFGKVGGGSAQETAAAVQQLGQALASGRLQGDELRSILENMPQLGEALADALGVGIGRLREMGTAGELTAEKVFRGILSKGGDADRMFAGLGLTVDRATAQMETAWSRLTGEIDKALGLSQAYAKAVSDAARVIDGIRRNQTPQGQFDNANRQIAELDAAVERARQVRDKGFPLLGDRKQIGDFIDAGTTLDGYEARRKALEAQRDALGEVVREQNRLNASLTLADQRAAAGKKAEAAVEAERARAKALAEVNTQQARELELAKLVKNEREQQVAADKAEADLRKALKDSTRQATDEEIKGARARAIEGKAAEQATEAAAEAQSKAATAAKTRADQAARAAEREKEKRDDATASIGRQIAGLKDETGQISKTARERAIHAEVLKAEEAARRANIQLTAEQRKELEREAGALFDRKKTADDAADATKANNARLAEAAREQAREVARTYDRVVDFGADAFDRMLERSGSTWRDMADDLLSVFRKAFAQLAAESVIRPAVEWAGSALGFGGNAGGMSGGLANGGGFNLFGNGGALGNGGWLDQNIGTRLGFSSGVEAARPAAGFVGPMPAEQGSTFGGATLSGGLGVGLTSAAVGGAVGGAIGRSSGSRALGGVSGAAMGALSGAAMGSVVPGIGTAVGAVIGGVMGGLTGLLSGGGQTDKQNATAGAVSLDRGVVLSRTSTQGSAENMAARDQTARTLRQSGISVQSAFGTGVRLADVGYSFRDRTGNVVRVGGQEFNVGKDDSEVARRGFLESIKASSGLTGLQRRVLTRGGLDELSSGLSFLKEYDTATSNRTNYQSTVKGIDDKYQALRAQAYSYGLDGNSAEIKKLNAARSNEISEARKAIFDDLADARNRLVNPMKMELDQLNRNQVERRKEVMSLYTDAEARKKASANLSDLEKKERAEITARYEAKRREAQVDLRARELTLKGDDRGAAAVQFDQAARLERERAKEAGLSSAEMSRLEKVLAAERKQLLDDLVKQAYEARRAIQQNVRAREQRVAGRPGGELAATLIEFDEAARLERERAVEAKLSAYELVRLEKLQAAERAKIVADAGKAAWSAAHAVNVSQATRAATLRGDTRTAALIQLDEQQRQEREAALAAVGPGTGHTWIYAELLKVQKAERAKLLADLAREAANAKKAITVNLGARELRAAGKELQASLLEFDEAARLERERARDASYTAAELVRLEKVQAAERLKVIEESNKATLEKQKQLGDDLRRYLDSQKLGDNSSLSASEKLAEARRQFVAGLASAKGGDETAVRNLTGLADTLISQGRGYYGSGTGAASLESYVRGEIEKLGKALKLPGFAAGTSNAPGGLAWVGERGRELVAFNGGERVLNAGMSARLVANQNGDQVVAAINRGTQVAAQSALGVQARLDGMAAELAELRQAMRRVAAGN